MYIKQFSKCEAWIYLSSLLNKKNLIGHILLIFNCSTMDYFWKLRAKSQLFLQFIFVIFRYFQSYPLCVDYLILFWTRIAKKCFFFGMNSDRNL